MPPATIVIAVRASSEKELDREVIVAHGAAIVVGRDPGADLVLDDERVSRRHLRIRARRGGVIVEDLGSTNGSFLNGLPVTRDLARAGDRIVVGTTVLEIREHAPLHAPRRALAPDPARSTMHDESPWLSGQLREIPIFVVIQILSSMRKSGRLVVHGPRTGTVDFGDGALVDAAVDGLPLHHGRKALFRVLGWKDGSFELHPEVEAPLVATLEGPIEALLLEGHRQLDELERITPKLPAPEVRIARRIEALGGLGPIEREVARLASTAPSWEQLLDACPATDLETAEALLALLGSGALSALPADAP